MYMTLTKKMFVVIVRNGIYASYSIQSVKKKIVFWHKQIVAVWVVEALLVSII